MSYIKKAPRWVYASHLSGACEFPSLGKWAPALTRGEPESMKPGLILNYMQISSVTCPAFWTQVPMHCWDRSQPKGSYVTMFLNVQGPQVFLKWHVHQEPQNVNLLEIGSL